MFFHCRMKLKSTTNYIYQVLFINGENSDITINALEKEWKLHKLYLKQVGYQTTYVYSFAVPTLMLCILLLLCVFCCDVYSISVRTLVAIPCCLFCCYAYSVAMRTLLL